jgi:hypothetical protein
MEQPAAKVKQRLDTKLEAEAAEFLVLGHLLLHGISAYKAYVNFPGYDLLAINPQTRRQARLQVKSRFRTDWDGFIIKDCENCDFVIFVALNRGKGGGKKMGCHKEPPQFFILPIEWVREVRDPTNKWKKIVKSRLKGIADFEGCWPQISDFLAVKTENQTGEQTEEEGLCPQLMNWQEP